MAMALRRVRPSTALWVLPFVGALVFLDVWCARGLYSGGQGDVSNSCMAIFAAAALTLPRNRVADVLNRKRGLSIDMIRHLHEQLGISAEVLIRPSRFDKAA